VIVDRIELLNMLKIMDFIITLINGLVQGINWTANIT